jgi:hypothetical protein
VYFQQENIATTHTWQHQNGKNLECEQEERKNK